MKGALVFLTVLGVALAGAPKALPECPTPIPGDEAISIGNPDDCSTFYTCVSTTPILMQCYPGLWFNPIEGVCDYPGNIPEGVCIPPEEPTPTPETYSN